MLLEKSDFRYCYRTVSMQHTVFGGGTVSRTYGIYRHNKHIYDNYYWGGFGQEFFSVSASVCDSRKWNSRSNSFVPAPYSRSDSNAPRPAVSVPHLAGIGYVSWARQASSAQFFFVFGRYTPDLFLNLGMCKAWTRKTYGKTFFLKLASFRNWLASYFVPTTLFSWSHLEAFGLLCTSYDWLLCRCFSISDFKVNCLCSSVFVVFEGGRSLPNKIITPSVRADSSS